MRRIERNADTGADFQSDAIDLQRRGDRGQRARCHQVGKVRRIEILQPDGKFVATQTRDFPAAQIADLVLNHQAAGDLHQQCVADRMAERVVDFLKAIEVDQQQGALRAGAAVGNRSVDMPLQRDPVL